MPRFSACIEMIFRALPFEERIGAVRAAGLEAVEFWQWRTRNLDRIAEECNRHGVTVAAMLMETGGPLTTGGDIDALLAGVSESVDAARKLEARTLIVTTGNADPEVSRETQHEMVVAKLQAAAPLLEDGGVTAALEPLNVLVDHPGYYLVTSEEGFRIVDEVGSPNVKLLFDIYHQQISEGNVLRTLMQNLDRIAHIHAADNPGRHEPGTGELNYSRIFHALDEANYAGWVGLEYHPLSDPAAGLRQVLALAR
jgi:hydroxypyruvate isomerase